MAKKKDNAYSITVRHMSSGLKLTGIFYSHSVEDAKEQAKVFYSNDLGCFECEIAIESFEALNID